MKYCIYLLIDLLCAGLISTTVTSQQECNDTTPADMVFIIDGSGSVEPNDFNKSLQFCIRLVDAFEIGPTKTQVALIVFNLTAEVEFNFNTYKDALSLKSAIANTRYPGGGTSMPTAIEKAIEMFNSSHRQGTTGIAILMTDGDGSGDESSISAAQQLKNLGVTIYCTGVRTLSNDSVRQLQNIASKTSYYFEVGDFSAPQIISGPLKSSACSAICDASPCLKGTCVVSSNSWYCSCPLGFTGTLCDTDIDECAISPCENGGTCHNRINAFYCECPPKWYGIYCETGICQPSVADIVFVLDSSSSQTKEEFVKQLDFINLFIDHIVIGEYNFQVGVVTYSFQAVTEISLGEFKNNITLKDAVRKIKYRPGATFTDKGLEEAMEVFNNAPRQRPYGHLAKRFAFVLTDGLSTNRVSTAKAAVKLRSTDVKILALGIGKEVSHRELLSIASTDDKITGRKYVYSVQNFNALYSVMHELVRLTCDECYWKTSSDVLFLLDMSTSVSVDDFQTGLNAITYLVNKTTHMENETNAVRIALVTYGTSIQLHRTLNDSETKHNFLARIQSLVILEGNCQAGAGQCDSSGLDDALRYADQNVFDKTRKATNETREMVIIVSDGQHSFTDETYTELESLRKGGKFVYVIAIGRNVDLENLKRLVGDPALIFSVYDTLSTSSLDALTTEFFFSSCDLTNDFQNG